MSKVASRRNPPGPRYTRLLGRGMWADAYGSDQDDTVEVIVCTRRYEWGDKDFDAGKEVLLAVRKALKREPDLLEYLPEIRRKRITKDELGRPEVVYEMPQYYVVERHDTLAHLVSLAVESAWRQSSSFEDAAVLIEASAQASNYGIVSAQLLSVAQVVRALDQACDTPVLRRARLDLPARNMAVDSTGHLILLDPVSAVVPWAKARRRMSRWPW